MFIHTFQQLLQCIKTPQNKLSVCCVHVTLFYIYCWITKEFYLIISLVAAIHKYQHLFINAKTIWEQSPHKTLRDDTKLQNYKSWRLEFMDQGKDKIRGIPQRRTGSSACGKNCIYIITSKLFLYECNVLALYASEARPISTIFSLKASTVDQIAQKCHFYRPVSWSDDCPASSMKAKTVTKSKIQLLKFNLVSQKHNHHKIFDIIT